MTRTSRRFISPSVLLLLLIAACLGGLVLEKTTHIARRAYDRYILDNRDHYFPCRRLPPLAEVEAVVQAHAETVQRIEQVNPGNAGMEIDGTTCPGKADLVIWYATHQDRLEIEKMIGGDTFFGVPYRLQNR